MSARTHAMLALVWYTNKVARVHYAAKEGVKDGRN